MDDVRELLGSEDVAEANDLVLPFSVPALDVRGRCVKLGPALDAILARHGYPEPVSHLIAEAALLAVMLGSAMKFEGRFQLQAKTDGIVDLLVVDFDTPDRFRAMARFDAERLASADDLSGAALLGAGHLGLTVDQGSHASRYQGIVALDGEGLEQAAQAYFRQSEQIPTLVRLAAGEIIDRDGAHIRAGGLMIQFLPTSPDKLRARDLHPGDAPEGASIMAETEDDSWREARLLAGTIQPHELIDPSLSPERIVYRLFHERGAYAHAPLQLVEACRCSPEGIMAMMRRFAPDDRRDMIADDGMIAITCEFCSRHHRLDPAEVERTLA
ncbi:MAG: Hsp33 family molecular chaperone [Bosea sp. (in: a-proteobacteria)]